jgi:hypothetical protein
MMNFYNFIYFTFFYTLHFYILNIFIYFTFLYTLHFYILYIFIYFTFLYTLHFSDAHFMVIIYLLQELFYYDWLQDNWSKSGVTFSVFAIISCIRHVVFIWKPFIFLFLKCFTISSHFVARSTHLFS